jgi:hypothetical protein
MKRSSIQLIVALVLFGVAGLFLFRFWRSERSSEPRAYFYDESEGKLFAGPHSAVPPIPGLDEKAADGVRAVVISLNGDCADEKSRSIAYLEKYSPELKQQLELAAGGTVSADATGRIGRGEAQGHTFVRTVSDPRWHPRNSPEGERIVTEWQRPGPDGALPLICSP